MSNTQTPPTMEPPSTHEPPPAAHPPLERIEDGRILTGLAAGLGRRFDLNPWWFRTGFIILTLFGGLGVFLYLVGWLLVPEQGHRDSLAVELARKAERNGAETWIGIGLVGIAALIILGWLGFLGNGLFWAALLAVIGVLLYRGDLKVRPPDQNPPAAPLPPQEPRGDSATEGGEAGPPPVSEAAPVPAAEVPPRPKRRRSLLGVITTGVAFIAVGILATLDAAGTIDPSFADYVAVTVGILGLGLIAGAVWGRSIALIVFGVLMLPILFTARFVPFPLNANFGEITYRPLTIEEVQDEYSLAAGSLRVDLSNVDFTGDSRHVKVSIGAGEIIVVTPDPRNTAVTIVVDGSVGVGEIVAFGEESNGFGLASTTEIPGNDGELFLEIQAGAGSVRISEGR